MPTNEHQLMPVHETLKERLSIAQIEDRRNAIKQLMRKVMKKGIDYGRIPGTPKPTLLKPGAEKLCALFQLAPRIVYTRDMMTADGVTYEAKVQLFTIGTDTFCGEGVGVCTTNETRYRWRAALCKEEWEDMAAERRRVAYKKDNSGAIYTVAQIRTEEADLANTVLKMSVKRALIAATLSVTGVSDIFTQDMEPDEEEEPAEDEPEDEEEGDDDEETAPQPPPKKAPAQAPPASKPQPTAANRTAPQAATITQPQAGRFYAIAKGTNKSDEQIKKYLMARFHIEHSRDLRRDQYDEACLWAAGVVPTDVREEDDPDDDVPF
jgi:hypothetical protein